MGGIYLHFLHFFEVIVGINSAAEPTASHRTGDFNL